MNLEAILAQALEAVDTAIEIANLEDVRVNYLGKKRRNYEFVKKLR
jgi:phenylalanyl-tRNA synthetase alpha chain